MAHPRLTQDDLKAIAGALIERLAGDFDARENVESEVERIWLRTHAERALEKVKARLRQKKEVA